VTLDWLARKAALELRSGFESCETGLQSLPLEKRRQIFTLGTPLTFLRCPVPTNWARTAANSQAFRGARERKL